MWLEAIGKVPQSLILFHLQLNLIVVFLSFYTAALVEIGLCAGDQNPRRNACGFDFWARAAINLLFTISSLV